MTKLTALCRGFIRDEEGATAVEYGVLIALIIGVLIVIISILGGHLNTGFTQVSTAVENANNGG